MEFFEKNVKYKNFDLIMKLEILSDIRKCSNYLEATNILNWVIQYHQLQNSKQMEEQLQFIEDFANTIANTFKQFAQLCRLHLKKAQNSRPQFAQLQAQLIEQRKKRMELQEKIRQKLSGSAPNGEPLVPPLEEKKRPQNAFTLFLADQRDKIIRQCPGLELQKINSMAVIKWKKMSEEQRMIYQRKFQEMNKYYEEQDYQARHNKKVAESNETAAVKRQFRQEDENNKQNQEPEEQPMEQHTQKQVTYNQQLLMEPQQDLMGTVVMNNDVEQQKTLHMEEEFRPSRNVQQILDLFHTPLNISLQQQRVEAAVQNQSKILQQLQQRPQPQAQPQVQPQAQAQPELDPEAEAKPQPKPEPQPQAQPKSQTVQAHPRPAFDPSLQIISQIVIDPTIQQDIQ